MQGIQRDISFGLGYNRIYNLEYQFPHTQLETASNNSRVLQRVTEIAFMLHTLMYSGSEDPYEGKDVIKTLQRLSQVAVAYAAWPDRHTNSMSLPHTAIGMRTWNVVDRYLSTIGVESFYQPDRTNESAYSTRLKNIRDSFMQLSGIFACPYDEPREPKTPIQTFFRETITGNILPEIRYRLEWYRECLDHFVQKPNELQRLQRDLATYLTIAHAMGVQLEQQEIDSINEICKSNSLSE